MSRTHPRGEHNQKLSFPFHSSAWIRLCLKEALLWTLATLTCNPSPKFWFCFCLQEGVIITGKESPDRSLPALSIPFFLPAAQETNLQPKVGTSQRSSPLPQKVPATLPVLFLMF